MTKREYNEILNKINQIISDRIYKKNIPSLFSKDKFDNVIWKMKVGKTKIGICLFNYKNINPFNEIILVIKIDNAPKSLYKHVEPFKSDYCIKGIKENIINKIQAFLSLLTTANTNMIYKKNFHMN